MPAPEPLRERIAEFVILNIKWRRFLNAKNGGAAGPGSGPVSPKLSEVAIKRETAAEGSASAFRQLGYLTPEAHLSAVLDVQAAGEGLMCLEITKVLDARRE